MWLTILGVMAVDIGLNRLYCAACNVQVNSAFQFHQVTIILLRKTDSTAGCCKKCKYFKLHYKIFLGSECSPVEKFEQGKLFLRHIFGLGEHLLPGAFSSYDFIKDGCRLITELLISMLILDWFTWNLCILSYFEYI